MSPRKKQEQNSDQHKRFEIDKECSRGRVQLRKRHEPCMSLLDETFTVTMFIGLVERTPLDRGAALPRAAKRDRPRASGRCGGAVPSRPAPSAAGDEHDRGEEEEEEYARAVAFLRVFHARGTGIGAPVAPGRALGGIPEAADDGADLASDFARADVGAARPRRKLRKAAASWCLRDLDGGAAAVADDDGRRRSPPPPSPPPGPSGGDNGDAPVAKRHRGASGWLLFDEGPLHLSLKNE